MGRGKEWRWIDDGGKWKAIGELCAGTRSPWLCLREKLAVHRARQTLVNPLQFCPQIHVNNRLDRVTFH